MSHGGRTESAKHPKLAAYHETNHRHDVSRQLANPRPETTALATADETRQRAARWVSPRPAELSVVDKSRPCFCCSVRSACMIEHMFEFSENLCLFLG